MHKVLLAPTTLPDAPPMEYIAAAREAGYDGMALRVHPSPGLPFHPFLGDALRLREVRSALPDAPPVWEIGSFYLQPDTDVRAFERALAFGGELKAKTAFVIGDDPDRQRLRDNFARFCALASPFGLSAFVEFVPHRPLGTLAETLKLFAESGCANVAVCVDPLNFTRSGGMIAEIAAIDRRYLPYAQLSDGLVYADEKGPSPAMRPNTRRLPGEGDVPLAAILAALPEGIALSVEFPQAHVLAGSQSEMPATEWAKFVLARSRDYLGELAVRAKRQNGGTQP